MKVKIPLNYEFDGLSSKNWASSSGTSQRSNKMGRYKIGAHLTNNHLANNNNEDINNIKRPAESINFCGSAGSIALKAPKSMGLTDRLARSKTFHKMAYKSEKNEAMIKALIALGLAGVLKPLCVLAMPGAEEEDKQFTATKNFLSAVIGYLLSCAIFNPISNGVNEFLKHPDKYIKDENNWLVKTFKEQAEESAKDKKFEKLILTPELIKKGKEEAAKNKVPYYYTDMKAGMKTVYKNAPGLIVAPLKAALTIALMPYVLKFVFGDSKGKKKAQKQEQMPPAMDILNNSVLTQNRMQINNFNKVFDTFTKGGLQK